MQIQFEICTRTNVCLAHEICSESTALKAFLFDLDGTLGNTVPLCVAAFREALEPLVGRTLTDGEIIATFGPSEEGTIAAFAPQHFDEGMARYLKAYTRLHDHWPNPFSGIRELLIELKQRGTFIGLVTGKGPLSLAVTLQRYDFESLFDAVKAGQPEKAVKDICIDELVTEYALERQSTLYVGDTPYDMRVSRACGLKVAAAAWAPAADAAKLRACSPDYLFETVQALADLVRAGQL